MKISGQNILFSAIKEVYIVEIDFMKGPKFEVMYYPKFPYISDVEDNIEDKFQDSWLNQGSYFWFKILYRKFIFNVRGLKAIFVQIITIVN